jgi:hypothetical protein
VAIRVKLSDGNEFLVDATLARWDSAFRAALAQNAVLEIQLPDGSIKPIDPRSIESFREEPEAARELEFQLATADR